MSERIDHVAEARRYLESLKHLEGQHLELDMHMAEVHASLALVKQQRIANLIAVGEAFEKHEPWDFDAPKVLKPEIREALGI